jgi:hypothetical protein
VDSPHRPLRIFPPVAADAPEPVRERSTAEATVSADPALALALTSAESPWTRAEPPTALASATLHELAAGGETRTQPNGLAERASPRIAWAEMVEPGTAPDPEDRDAFEAYARHFAVARFARRVLAPDPHAWVEALVTYREYIRLPVDVPFRVSVEPDLSVRLVLELPAPSAIPPLTRETVAQQRARYAELCARVALTFADEAFRLLPPAADSVYVTAYRAEANPATGHPRNAILLRLATDRASMADVDLAHASATAAFAHLGGALQLQRGELIPLAFEDYAERIG